MECGNILRPPLSKTELMVRKYLRSRDYQLGMGLEKDGSGIISPILLKCQNNTFDWDTEQIKEIDGI